MIEEESLLTTKINMEKRLAGEAPETMPLQKKAYNKPQLNRFGSVTEITAGISGGTGESGDPTVKKSDTGFP